MVLSKKYAQALIRAGKAAREYKPLVRCTEARKLDGIYAVLRRVDAAGNVRFDHFVA
jgi:hypothetical protein